VDEGELKDVITNIDEVAQTVVLSSEANKWLIEITTELIKFNKENYPLYIPEALAQEFVDILENQYDVKFEKRKS